VSSDPKSLPPGLDLLWGRRERGTRGPKPGLSIDGIVAKAIEIADAEGLAAVSMARVAKELGFTTMSLYRYVAGKDELLQLMWNASAQGAEEYVVEGDGWRERLRGWALVQREMIDRHAWITEMPMATPPLAPNSLTFVERGLEALDGTGLADADQLRVIGLISSYTLSESRMAHEAARAAAAAPADAPRWTFESLLGELVDAESYPRLSRIASGGGDAPAEGPPAAGASSEADEFRLGLETILDGVESLVERDGRR
jgi:AcrR family transcriptional regulator